MRSSGNYRTAFPDFDPATMPAECAAWADISWRQDACPCFDTGTHVVFVNFADPALREFPDQPRFFACPHCEGEELNTDDWGAVLAFVGASQN